jgi:hypothetical protein
MYQLAIKYTKKGRKMDKMAIKYTNIFHCKTHRNLAELGFLILK